MNECPKCHRVLQDGKENFPGWGGSRMCRSCLCERQRIYNAEHPDKLKAVNKKQYDKNRDDRVAYSTTYYALHREEILEKRAEKYAVDPDKKKEQSREYRASNPEKCREAVKAYRAAHPEVKKASGAQRRARKKNGTGCHTSTDIREQYERQKGKCFYCGKRVGDRYHVDHVTPLALGGSNGPENIVIACPECNCSKHAKHPMEFAGILL